MITFSIISMIYLTIYTQTRNANTKSRHDSSIKCRCRTDCENTKKSHKVRNVAIRFLFLVSAPSHRSVMPEAEHEDTFVFEVQNYPELKPEAAVLTALSEIVYTNKRFCPNTDKRRDFPPSGSQMRATTESSILSPGNFFRHNGLRQFFKTTASFCASQTLTVVEFGTLLKKETKNSLHNLLP